MKRKITALALTVFSAFVLLLQGCNAGSYINVAGKTYTYTGESAYGIENDPFTINLNPNGTFTYFESIFSSYMGVGNWSVNGDVLTLTEDSGACYGLENSFRIDGNTLVFIENSSDNFPKVTVKDGESFTSD